MAKHVPPSALDIAEKRKQRRRLARISTVVAALVAVLAFGAWIVARSPFTRFSAIAVERAEVAPAFRDLAMHHLSEREVREFLAREARLQGFFPRFLGPLSFFVWPDALSDGEISRIPSLRNLALEKDYADRVLRVTYEERQPVGTWCFRAEETTRCFWFDEDGILFRDALLSEGTLYMTIGDYSRNAAGLGERALRQPLFGNLLSVMRVLASSSVAIREIRLKDVGLEEVAAAPYEGPALYFSLRFPADHVLGALQSFLTSGSARHADTLEYVDFRVEGRAYYR